MPNMSDSASIVDSLLPKLAENIGVKKVNQSVDWCSGKVQQSQEPACTSRLFQALLGQAVELLDPRLQQRSKTLRRLYVSSSVDYFS